MNREERIRIETLQREELSRAQIGERSGRPERTISRELKRGWVTHRTGRYRAEERYSADRGQTVYEKRMRLKGRESKAAAASATSGHSRSKNISRP